MASMMAHLRLVVFVLESFEFRKQRLLIPVLEVFLEFFENVLELFGVEIELPAQFDIILAQRLDFGFDFFTPGLGVNGFEFSRQVGKLRILCLM